MKRRLLQFIDLLRERGIRITAAETLDATRSLGIIGVEPLPFREGLAAALIKDEAERPTFDEVFDTFFAAPPRVAPNRRRQEPAAGGERGRLQRQERGAQALPNNRPPERKPTMRPADREDAERYASAERRRRMAQERALMDVPLKQMTAAQEEECELLLEQLAQRLRGHVSRRRRAARRGHLDVRRTLRRSIATGGVPLQRQFRKRRPDRPGLVALCDLSHSVAIVSRFFLSLLGPASHFFRRVRLFGYVDTPVEIWLEDGQLVTAARIDLYARSDFGNLLRIFNEQYAPLVTRSTLLLILGDARNNRRPPRGDLLARLREGAQDVVWLNPEAEDRWNTGDSAMRAYEPHCGRVLIASTLRQLYLALNAIWR